MFRIGIVGSGPAAFYTAQKLLKLSNKIEIDMFEKLPVPFGLIRYGVAPDHPEVKNVFKTFTQVARNERFRFFGNVTVGQDVRIKEMRHFYHGIVLAYGAAQVNKLNIAGENLKQVYSALDLVGWYNGVPDKEGFVPDLRGTESIIIGHGNVALDIARIFLSPIDELRKTDIPDPVLSQLAESKIETVHLVGRRGPVQAAFTIKEFRELLRLDAVRSHIHVNDEIDLRPEMIDLLPRPRKRMMSLIAETLTKQRENCKILNGDARKRSWQMHFLRSPIAICDSKSRPGNVDHVKFRVNALQGDSIRETDATVDMSCQMVVSSIGYKSVQIDPDVPFDNKKNIIPNNNGRVIEEEKCESSKSVLYCVGWIKRGPVGVIVNTLSDAQETSSTIIKDLERRTSPVKISEDIKDFFQGKGVKYISFANWEAIDRIETSLGEQKGKPREKLISISDMLKAARISNDEEK